MASAQGGNVRVNERESTSNSQSTQINKSAAQNNNTNYQNSLYSQKSEPN